MLTARSSASRTRDRNAESRVGIGCTSMPEFIDVQISTRMKTAQDPSLRGELRYSSTEC
jgi:hypothetical protein